MGLKTEVGKVCLTQGGPLFFRVVVFNEETGKKVTWWIPPDKPPDSYLRELKACCDVHFPGEEIEIPVL